MAPTRITLVAHTHWDREWYEPFEVFRAHLVEMLDEALTDLEVDPRLQFTLDGHVALVDDYLEVRPAAEPRIRALVTAGRLHIGPWYTQADTLLTDGESLIRNLVFGIRRAERLGGAMRVGYMPDQFGHAGQIPQILRLFDIDCAVLWRGVGPDRPPQAFRWSAPDGSVVTAVWLQDGYSSGRRLPSDAEGFADAIERLFERLGDWLGDLPVLVPVGDDHVKLASWVPEAAAALRRRRPELEVTLGGYQHHLPFVVKAASEHNVYGELRSPAFAPVLAGVTSARIREKQAAAEATTLLLHYAEPLAAWAAQVSTRQKAKEAQSRTLSLITRAWRQLLLNQAHDSAAGCGSDASHEDVKARYRWAEQLARTACESALAQLQVEAPAVKGAASHVVVFHPGPAVETLFVEAHVPRALEGALMAAGPDGVARPVQALGDVDVRPLFEGEFAAAELGQYLGGIDPRTPLFGKFLTGIRAQPDGAGTVRLDVGLGDVPASPASLVEDQRRIAALLTENERFKVVVHGAGITRPILLMAGPAPEASFINVVVSPATTGGAAFAPVTAEDGDFPRLVSGSLSVVAQADGTVLIHDTEVGLTAVRANDLVDEGDRGDLYHFDLAGAPLRAHAARTRILEAGPLRARLRIDQDFDLPVALASDHRARSTITLPTTITTEVTVHAGRRRVDFVSTFDNRACDHRLRAMVHLPLVVDRLDVEHGLSVVERPLDPTKALGAGAERAALTGQHHGFIDVGDGAHGVALMSRGLLEHEVVKEVVKADGATSGSPITHLALTLLRSVGWLSRGDLSVIDQAAGPMAETPGAQELGPHRFEYALLLHQGGWEAASIPVEARRYAAPPMTVTPTGTTPVPLSRALVKVRPASVAMIALYPSEAGNATVVRLLNASPRAVVATLRPAVAATAVEVDPLEQPTPNSTLTTRGDSIDLPLGPWKIATVLLRQ